MSFRLHDAALRETTELRNQLAKAQARIAELEAEVGRLRGALEQEANNCPVCEGTQHEIVCCDPYDEIPCRGCSHILAALSPAPPEPPRNAEVGRLREVLDKIKARASFALTEPPDSDTEYFAEIVDLADAALSPAPPAHDPNTCDNTCPSCLGIDPPTTPRWMGPAEYTERREYGDLPPEDAHPNLAPLTREWMIAQEAQLKVMTEHNPTDPRQEETSTVTAEGRVLVDTNAIIRNPKIRDFLNELEAVMQRSKKPSVDEIRQEAMERVCRAAKGFVEIKQWPPNFTSWAEFLDEVDSLAALDKEAPDA